MNWLETHKHLAMVLVVTVAVLLIVFKLVAHFDGVAHDKRVLAEQQVKVDLQKAALLASQTNTDSTALKAQLDSLAASNRSLQAQLAQLQQQLAAQRAKNDTMAPSDLAARWHFLVPDGQVKAVPDGLTADLVASHATVNALEEVPVLKEQNSQLLANSQIKDNTIAQALKVRDDKDAELQQCKTTLKDAETACDRKVRDIKGQARKRNLIVSVAAFIGGIIFSKKF